MAVTPLPTQPRFVIRVVVIIGAFLGIMLACARTTGPASAPWSVSDIQSTPLPTQVPATVGAVYAPVSVDPAAPAVSPTPDRPHRLAAPRSEPEEYYVRSGDTLGEIAREYKIPLEMLISENELPNPDVLEVGQLIVIPAPTPGPTGPDFKVVPDSELVYGPASVGFDIKQFIQSEGGYLAQYYEDVEGATLTGAEVVARVAYEYSVNPRLLLAALEYQSGWVTETDPAEETREYPMGKYESWRNGLYRQLAWAANNLNTGYYLWRVGGASAWNLAEGEVVPPAATINAGTAAVQFFYAQLYGRSKWEQAIGPDGLFAAYNRFFGYPFNWTVDPLIPGGLTQPIFQLPFEMEKEWSFTGGPHGGWGGGSGWAAIDFAPPGPALGCVDSDEWVVAIADGLILRSANGAVVQDLNFNGIEADGYEQTGWTILYMHIETRDRVPTGTFVRAGERIGHPSCEGGVSSGTHLHLARRYNGEWIPADQELPFVLDGWVSRGAGSEYDGYLQKDGHSIEALVGRFSENAIQR